MRRTWLAFAVVVALGACGGGGGDDDSTSDADEAIERLSTTDPDRPVSPTKALCEDLEAGLTPVESYELYFSDEYDEETFAHRVYGFATIGCKEQLQSNDAVREFLESYDIDPDI